MSQLGSVTWDYIIIGAGSAGCTLANRLSVSGEKKVLIIEAGGSDANLAVSVPAGVGLFSKMAKKMDWSYSSEPDPTRNGATEAWPRGRVIGGSSSVNGTVYVRGSATDFDRWESMGNYGWGANHVLPIFKAIESSDQPGELRGHTGDLKIRTVKLCHPSTEAFLFACEQQGMVRNPDYNGKKQEGISYVQLNQKGRFRCSAADAFLKPAMRRANTKLLKNTLVHKVLIENKRAVGVRVEVDGKRQDIAGKNIISCAGAINSPQLLMLSGIGDAHDLEKYGIPLIVDRSSVGSNLIEHQQISLIYQMKEPTYSPTEGIFHKVGLLYRYLFQGQGPLSNICEGMGFFRSSTDQTSPDLQVCFSPWCTDETGADGWFDNSRTKFLHRGVWIPINNSYPLSSGKIRLASQDPKVSPLIECHFFEKQEDIETLIKGVKVIRKVMSSPAIKDMVAREVFPGKDVISDQEMADYIRNNAGINAHPAGTCRMGVDDAAVVTPDLKVRGIDNLWVADASIMPDHISGNINAACMMIGEKLGRELSKL